MKRYLTIGLRWWPAAYLVDGERAASTAGPDVLLVVIVLAVNLHLISDQVGRVETHSELSDHTDVCSCTQGFHEGFSAGLGDRSWNIVMWRFASQMFFNLRISKQ